MIDFIYLGIALFLLMVGIIDWRTKTLPSIMLTGGLFVIVALNPANIYYGLLTFLLSYLLYEADFFGGVADIKIMTFLGFLIPDFFTFGIFVVFFAIFGMTWKIVYKWRNPKDTETAFLPVFLFVFLALWFGGVI